MGISSGALCISSAAAHWSPAVIELVQLVRTRWRENCFVGIKKRFQLCFETRGPQQMCASSCCWAQLPLSAGSPFICSAERVRELLLRATHLFVAAIDGCGSPGLAPNRQHDGTAGCVGAGAVLEGTAKQSARRGKRRGRRRKPSDKGPRIYRGRPLTCSIVPRGCGEELTCRRNTPVSCN